MARSTRRTRQPANRRSVTSPLAGKPGGEPPARRRGVGGVAGFAGEVRGELAKVEFPDRQATLQATAVVIAACVLVGGYLYGLDQIFAVLVKHLVDAQNG
jgi:preprotein translocase subunit SecE